MQEQEPEGDRFDDYDDGGDGEPVEEREPQKDEWNDPAEDKGQLEKGGDRLNEFDGESIEESKAQAQEGGSLDERDDPVEERVTQEKEKDILKEFKDGSVEEGERQEKEGDRFDDLDGEPGKKQEQEQTRDTLDDLDTDPQRQEETDGRVDEELVTNRQEPDVTEDRRTQTGDVLLGDSQEDVGGDKDIMEEPKDVRDDASEDAMHEVEDVPDDLLPDEGKPVVEERKTDDFTFEEHAESEKQVDGKQKDDDGDETAPEDEIQVEVRKEPEMKKEPIEIEIHHKDVATQTEDDQGDELMVEAAQEPSVNIEVEVHTPKIIVPEIIELELGDKETLDQAVKEEDEFNEFDRDFEEEARESESGQEEERLKEDETKYTTAKDADSKVGKAAKEPVLEMEESVTEDSVAEEPVLEMEDSMTEEVDKEPTFEMEESETETGSEGEGGDQPKDNITEERGREDASTQTDENLDNERKDGRMGEDGDGSPIEDSQEEIEEDEGKKLWVYSLVCGMHWPQRCERILLLITSGMLCIIFIPFNAHACVYPWSTLSPETVKIAA